MEKLWIKKSDAMESLSMKGMEKTFNSFVKRFKLKKHKVGRNIFFNKKEFESCVTRIADPILTIPYSEIKNLPSGRGRSELKVIEYHSVQRL